MKQLYHGVNDGEEFWEDKEMTIALLRPRSSRKWLLAKREPTGMEPVDGYAGTHIVDLIRRLNEEKFMGHQFRQDYSREWTRVNEDKPMVLKDSNPAVV
jgi:hypothetical protein